MKTIKTKKLKTKQNEQNKKMKHWDKNNNLIIRRRRKEKRKRILMPAPGTVHMVSCKVCEMSQNNLFEKYLRVTVSGNSINVI